MTGAGAKRATHVRREMQELAGQVHHLPGGAAVFAAPVVTEIAALIVLVDSLAGPARRLSPRHEAMWRMLTINDRRAGRDTQLDWGAASLGFQHEIDSETAAKALGMKTDTMRKYLRSGIIQGHKVGPKWRVPISSIVDYHNRKSVP